LALLRVGFSLPIPLPGFAVRSYRTFSTLPRDLAVPTAVCFLCHFPSGCPDRDFPGTLPAGVRTFLPLAGAIACPARVAGILDES